MSRLIFRWRQERREIEAAKPARRLPVRRERGLGVPIVLKSKDELQLMRVAGRHVAEVLRIVAAEVKPGVNIADLDRLVRKEYKQRGVAPTFLGYPPEAPKHEQFPASICISINSQIVHGIPRDRVLKDGDIVKLDLGATYKGYVGDSAMTVACGAIPPEAEQLMQVTEASLWQGIKQCVPGNRVGDIGHAIETFAQPYGYGLVREYVGHGVGRRMHEDPQVPNHGKPGTGTPLRAGLVIAIEPMLNLGTHETRKDPDGWTIWTADDSLSAHYEHTIAITPDGPDVLTLL